MNQRDEIPDGEISGDRQKIGRDLKGRWPRRWWHARFRAVRSEPSLLTYLAPLLEQKEEKKPIKDIKKMLRFSNRCKRRGSNLCLGREIRSESWRSESKPKQVRPAESERERERDPKGRVQGKKGHCVEKRSRGMPICHL